jgi:predicted DNA-binding antitoxin AbrB/MazE fold protein
MGQLVEAIYEKGTLRPLKPLRLSEEELKYYLNLS